MTHCSDLIYWRLIVRAETKRKRGRVQFYWGNFLGRGTKDGGFVEIKKTPGTALDCPHPAVILGTPLSRALTRLPGST